MMSWSRYDTPTTTLLEKTNQLSIHQLVAYHSACQVYNISNNQVPKYHYQRLFETTNETGAVETRSRSNLESRVDFKSSLARGSFFYQSSRIWNALPRSAKTASNIGAFKKQVRTWSRVNISVRP